MTALLAQATADDLSFLKWVAITGMLLSLVNGVLWVVYLIKELNTKRHAVATAADVAKSEERAEKRFEGMQGRLDQFESDYEERIVALHRRIEESTKQVTKTLMEMSREIGKLDGRTAHPH